MRSIVTLTLALTTAVAVVACAPARGGNGAGIAGGGGPIAVEERLPAPDIAAETLSGRTLRLSDLRGPVVVNFWASWCGPCVREEPHLVALSKTYDGDVQFVGVNVKDSRANGQAFVHRFGVPYPSWFDSSASIAGQFGGIGPAALPTTLVLDKEHRVAARLFGAVDGVTLGRAIDAVLQPPSETTLSLAKIRRQL